MLQVLHRGRPGSLYFVDERPDGAIVMLVCEEHQTASGSAEHGYLGVPAPRAEVFPMLGARSMEVAERQFDGPPFRAAIDVNRLPPGPASFDSDVFLDRVVEEADRSPDDIVRIELDTESAEQFGVSSSGGLALDEEARRREVLEEQRRRADEEVERQRQAALRVAEAEDARRREAARRRAEEEEEELRRKQQAEQERQQQQQQQQRYLGH